MIDALLLPILLVSTVLIIYAYLKGGEKSGTHIWGLQRKLDYLSDEKRLLEYRLKWKTFQLQILQDKELARGFYDTKTITKGKEMTETITIPVTDVFDAMEKNELPKVQRTLVTRDGSGAITGACAYGQAALHLGADPESLLQAITDWGRNYHAPIAQEVLDLNDGTDSTIAAIARYAKTKLPWDAKYQTITVRPRSDAAVD